MKIQPARLDDRLTFPGSSDPEYYPWAGPWKKEVWAMQYQQNAAAPARKNVPHPRLQAQMLQAASRRYGPQNL